MAKNLSGDLQVASANRLVDGVVVFLDDAGQWTPRLERAAVARDKRAGEILLERARAEAFTVVDPFLVAVTEDDDGRIEPLSACARRSAPRASPSTPLPPTRCVMPDTHFYRYDDYDRTLVGERVEQFRDQVRRRIAGELTEEQFKPLRLTNGLYLQLHAYMLRIAIPYGTLSSRQLRKLADIARKYDRGYGHFTTRQNLQLNWIKLEDAPDTWPPWPRSTCTPCRPRGNCIRNVTADHFAGAAADEIEDPRIWCEIVRQWSTLHPEFSFLPRKFKIAITGSPNDRAAVRVHDIGLRLWRERGGRGRLRGDRGRRPRPHADDRQDAARVPAAATSCSPISRRSLRVYNRYGRRDNIYKARIKILVHEIGAEKMREEVEAEYAAIKDGALKLPAETIEAIARQFAPPPCRTGRPSCRRSRR